MTYKAPRMSGALMRKGVIPASFAAALTGATGLGLLVQLEGNILKVYPDRIANNLPTQCAGDTGWDLKVGTVLTEKFCEDVNKTTLLKYGYKMLECTNWDHMTPSRVLALTLFGINVGIAGACGSAAVREINEGNIAYGCRLLAYKQNGSPNWSYAMGKYIQGLFNRRLVEMKYCLGDKL